MDFVESIKKIVSQFGTKKIAESSFIGLLDDYRAFDDEPRSSKTILKFWKDHGMLERVSNMSAKGSSWKNDVADIIHQTEKEGFDRNAASDLLHKLLLGMGIVKATFDWNKEFQKGPTCEEQLEAERKAKEKAAAKRKAKEEAKRKAKEEAESLAREKAKRKAEKKTARKERFEFAVDLLLVFLLKLRWVIIALLAFFIWRYWDKVVTTFGGKSQVEGVQDVPGEIFTVNGVSFKMVEVKGGTFQMGSESRSDEEKPHSETVSDFMIGETEVTQALWKAVMDDNPSNYKGKDRPVQNVSWYDCQKFVRRLSQLTGRNFRLPTEAEWEYAAGGGGTRARAFMIIQEVTKQRRSLGVIVVVRMM